MIRRRLNRVHIGFFGRRNAGKSSVVNAVTGQELAVVSETKGTTTDPVYKAMELLPLGAGHDYRHAGLRRHGRLGVNCASQKTKAGAQPDRRGGSYRRRRRRHEQTRTAS